MNHLRTLFIVSMLAIGATACLNNNGGEVPPELPKVNTEKEYVLTNVYSGTIFMVTGMGWEKDSAVVRAFIDRLKARGDEYPFRKIKANGAPEVQQKLSFSGETALLEQEGKEKEFTHAVVHTANNSILWLMAKADSTYETKKRPEAIVRELGYYSPVQYKATNLEPPTADFDVSITTRPEHYASIGEGLLEFPGIAYYLKTKEKVERSGQLNNFLNETFSRALVAGDTILIQGYRLDFK